MKSMYFCLRVFFRSECCIGGKPMAEPCLKFILAPFVNAKRLDRMQAPLFKPLL